MSTRAKIYLRIGKTARGYKVAASTKPNHSPLKTDSYASKHLPTVSFAIAVTIPDARFKIAEKELASLVLKPDEGESALEIEMDN